jgi:hypothetical protein
LLQEGKVENKYIQETELILVPMTNLNTRTEIIVTLERVLIIIESGKKLK